MNYKLPKEFADKWLAALRSGEYEQGKSYLYSYHHNGIIGKDKFCCLGVACAINGMSKEDLRAEFIKETWSMPMEIKGDRGSNLLVRAVTDLNDGTIAKHQADNKSFLEIADWIEQNVETY